MHTERRGRGERGRGKERDGDNDTEKRGRNSLLCWFSPQIPAVTHPLGESQSWESSPGFPHRYQDPGLEPSRLIPYLPKQRLTKNQGPLLQPSTSLLNTQAPQCGGRHLNELPAPRFIKHSFHFWQHKPSVVTAGDLKGLPTCTGTVPPAAALGRLPLALTCTHLGLSLAGNQAVRSQSQAAAPPQLSLLLAGSGLLYYLLFLYPHVAFRGAGVTAPREICA